MMRISAKALGVTTVLACFALGCGGSTSSTDTAGGGGTNQSPTATVNVSLPQGMPLAGEAITFDATASSDLDGAIVAYTWDFGDQTSPVSGEIVQHSFARPGTYTATLTVTDEQGGTGQTRFVVTVSGDPSEGDGGPGGIGGDAPDGESDVNLSPTAAISVSAVEAAIAGELIAFDGAQSTDRDGTVVTYEWDFGDQTPPAKGQSVEHVFEMPGTYVVSLKVTDDGGAIAMARTTITVGGNQNGNGGVAQDGENDTTEDGNGGTSGGDQADPGNGDAGGNQGGDSAPGGNDGSTGQDGRNYPGDQG